MVRGARFFAILLVTALVLPTSGCVTTALVVQTVEDPRFDVPESALRIAALAPLTLLLDAVLYAPFVLLALYAPGSANLSMPSDWGSSERKRTPTTSEGQDDSRSVRERLLERR